MSFRFDKHSLQGKVSDILSNAGHYVEIGQDIAETFRRTHPPEAAVSRLMDIAELVRMNQMPALPSGYPAFFVWPPKTLSPNGRVGENVADHD
jgi:hypothetical protein